VYFPPKVVKNGAFKSTDALSQFEFGSDTCLVV
jgi:hypothetical protein